MRVGLIVTAICLSIVGLASADEVTASMRRTNIPPEGLGPALRTLAKTYDFQVLYRTEVVGQLRTQGAVGVFTADEALKRLLMGTGLTYRYLDANTITILPVSTTSSAGGGPLSQKIDPAGSAASDAPKEEKKGASDRVVLAQADLGQAASEASVENQSRPEKRSTQIQEVVVTARKLAESLEDVPVAVSVLSAESMVQQGALSMQDYYASVPGLSITDNGAGRLSISMRGLSTGDVGNPTVGITIDDVPIGATDTAIINGAQFVPQLDPAELQRIEFLKGPQGTLYGASSLGGVMRYVTAVPDLTSTSGHIDLDGSAIQGGGDGYAVRGSVNAPVIPDKLALRVSAFVRHDPGFVDDPSQGKDNVNSTDFYGAHASLLFQATQKFSVQLSALTQSREGNGDSTLDTNYQYQPILGGLTQSRLPGTGRNDYATQLYTATLHYHADLFDAVSITGYSLNRSTEDEDQDLIFGGSGPNSLSEAFFGVSGATLLNTFDSSKFTQEVRLSSPTGSKLEWQLGGFYTDENNGTNHQQIVANDLASGVPVGIVLDTSFPSKYQEYAGFANLTYHFTDRFNVLVGGRESHNQQQYHQDLTGPLLGGLPDSITTRSKDNSFTYLVTPQLRVSDSLMTYARVATGYQAGGPNTPFTPGTPLPPTYAPSTTINYEIGLKARLFDRRLSIDADVFDINWSKVQLVGLTPITFASYVFNGGTARSDGVEIASEFKPSEELILNAAVAYTDAKLTNTAGNGFPGVSGDPLPFSSKFTASLSAEQWFRISPTVRGFVGATAAYVGKRYEGFPPTVGEPQPSIPSYSYGNVRTGIVTDGFTVTAFVRNVTNERGILNTAQESGSTPTSGIWRTAIITPRTIGISVSKAF